MDVELMRRELAEAIPQCSSRALKRSMRWAAELLDELPEDAACSVYLTAPQLSAGATLARVYIDAGEFSRAAALLEARAARGESAVEAFLRLYALYLSGEKLAQQTGVEQADTAERQSAENPYLRRVRSGAEEALARASGDGFLWYIKGVAERELNLREQARASLLRAVRLAPCNWSAWLELGTLVDGLEALDEVRVEHWAALFFRAHTLLQLQENRPALAACAQLRQALPGARSVLLAVAAVQYNLRNYAEARRLLEQLRQRDPHSLEGVDTLSDVLFVMEDRAALGALAQAVVRVDKYRPEVCFVIGNYYGMRGEHEKAVVYFKRALRLNPRYVPAWMLMGHEYIELRNTPAAVEAYRRAVDILSRRELRASTHASPRDPRAWYGLGQAYELLRMPFYALHYYRKAATLRPYDPRMWLALGSCFQALNKSPEAIRCFRRALAHGDRDTAAKQLAALYAAGGDSERAAKYFRRVLTLHDEDKGPTDPDGPDALRAMSFLIQHHNDRGEYAEAEQLALRMQDQDGPTQLKATHYLMQIVREAAAATAASGSAPRAQARTAGGGAGAAAVGTSFASADGNDSMMSTD